MSDITRWLAVGSGADTVRLVPVPPPSTGPDVFCKLQDAEARVAAERERCAKVCDDFFADPDVTDQISAAIRNLPT